MMLKWFLFFVLSVQKVIATTLDDKEKPPSLSIAANAPTDVLDQIFSHLDTRDILKTRLVCRNWKTASDEYPILDLRTFSNSQAESLFSTLGTKNIHLCNNTTHIFLNAPHLMNNDEAIDAFQYFDSLQALHVAQSLEFSKAMRLLHRIPHDLTEFSLDISYDSVDDRQLKRLAHRTERLSSSLQCFSLGIHPSLKGALLRQDGEGIATAVSTILCNHPFLKNLTLNLSGNNTGPNGAISIARHLKRLTHLEKLSIQLSGNHINDDGMKELAESFELLPNLEYLSLDLAVNSIGDDSIETLTRVIQKLSKLRTLELSFTSNYITEPNIHTFALTLRQHPLLQQISLQLGFNRGITDSTIQLLQEILPNAQISRT